ncbi:TniQ family protein [Dietzia sp. B19]|nr:TniQ family protein [Dietzia sp. B19]
MASPTKPLPSRVQLSGGEALDSYLERGALANGLTTVELLRLLDPRPDAESLTFALVQPSDDLLERIERVTTLKPCQAKSATLQRFANSRPLDFSGFAEPSAAAYRAISARGWFPLQGTQICPECLHSGRWLIEWRLPFIAVCDVHSSYLVPSCAHCRQRFRSRRTSPLRPELSIAQPCGNPLGPRRNCRHSVLAHPTEQSPPDDLEASKAVRRALAGVSLRCLGAETPPERYLADLRATAVLLMHIATHSTPESAAGWGESLRAEAALRRTELRGPRWGIRPADNPSIRGKAIAAAHQILTATTIETAAVMLDPWIAHIPSTHVGQAAWIRNRTPQTPTLSKIVQKSLQTRQSPSRQVAIRVGTDLADSHIPQVLPEELYEEHIVPIMESHSFLGRRFASLCLAKVARPGRSWSESASALGFQSEVGPSTARAVTKHVNWSSYEVADALEHVADALKHGTNYRSAESAVRRLASEIETWFPGWARSQNPRRRAVTLPYAITWMWIEVAHADLDTSPGWAEPPTRAEKASLRAFSQRLSETAKNALRTIAVQADATN